MTKTELTKQEIDLEEQEVELDLDFQTTDEIPVPHRLLDQVIGQEPAVEIVKKAAIQRRNVLLIGDPGTGKSMLGQALAELLPKEELEDILCLPNPNDSHNPRIMTVPTTEGRRIVTHYKMQAKSAERTRAILTIALPLSVLLIGIWQGEFLMAIFVAIIVFAVLSQMRSRRENLVPKLLVDNTESQVAPFNDATGAHAGALLGDVRHDPFQSGGLGTPAHDRVEAGLIHKSHKGVLYIDEVATLKQKTQQQLLTAMQERKLAITGQSELSSGAMVRTEAVPCDFILVASGNVETIRRMHPALRSRIRGYGYEIYMRDRIPDNTENRRKLVRFVAQEVTKDGKIPHFSLDAVKEIIREARRRAGRKQSMTLRLRDLGGLVRAAGDLAREAGVLYVQPEHVIAAKKMARSLEHQIADESIEHKKEYQFIQTTGSAIGRVNGLAVLGDQIGGMSGIVQPIEAQVTPAQGRGGRTIATGKLRVIARESVQNVTAIIKQYQGTDISNMDIHIQFLLSYSGVEGDSASISIATAVLSALEHLPVRQNVAMTGSLSVRAEVLPIGGATPKIEAAAMVGITDVIVPKANYEDVQLEPRWAEKVTVHPVDTLWEVLEIALIGWDSRKYRTRFDVLPQ